MKVSFPKEVTFIDTGERRPPILGEYAVYYNPTLKEFFGPFIEDGEYVEAYEWDNPKYYAIYRIKKWTTEV